MPPTKHLESLLLGELIVMFIELTQLFTLPWLAKFAAIPPTAPRDI